MMPLLPIDGYFGRAVADHREKDPSPASRIAEEKGAVNRPRLFLPARWGYDYMNFFMKLA